MASWAGVTALMRRIIAAPAAMFGSRGAWTPVVRESYSGAWQHNVTLGTESALNYAPVFACVDLIVGDCSKLRWRTVELSEDGIWLEVDNPAYAVLRRPNRNQTPLQFQQQWFTSKLVHGNTHVLKQRDSRGVVNALYVLDPTRVTPLIAEDGGVYYEVAPEGSELSGLGRLDQPLVIPAREIMHDRMLTPYHPLCGVSPLFAAALPAQHGLTITQNSALFFKNGSSPGGVLLAPGNISDSQAARYKADWQANFSGDNIGKIAVLSGNLKYEPLSVNAVDAQLIDQLKWTGEMICATYHVPAYMAGIGPLPPYANVEPALQLYYAQCLQRLLVGAEQTMDQGLEFPRPTQQGTEFDIDDLIWMNAETRTKAASDGIGSGGMAPNEARKKYFNLPPVPGGHTPYLQQQYYSLEALAARDADDPFAKPAPTAPPPLREDEAEDQDSVERAALRVAVAAELDRWWRL